MKVASTDQINSTTSNENTASEAAKESTVEVLYQKLGDRWYAFSIIGDEVFMGSVPMEDVHSSELDPKIGLK